MFHYSYINLFIDNYKVNLDLTDNLFKQKIEFTHLVNFE